MILAAEWIFPITSPPLYRHAIEIEHGAIRNIRPLLDSDIFLPDTCLLPGLVNAHTHLAYTAMRNLFDELEFFPWIRKLTETKLQKWTVQDIVASTQLGIQESLNAGITTVADMCDLEPALETLAQSPLRGIFYWEVFGVEKEQAERTWNSLQESYPRFRKKYESSRLRIGISPHSCFTVRPELFRQIADRAIADKIPISFHAAESKEEEDFIAQRGGGIGTFLQQRASDWQFLGNTSVSHLAETRIFDTRPLLAHAVQVDQNDIQILKDHDVSIAHCPKSNAKFGHGIAPLTDFASRNFRLGIGSDSAASNNRFDLFEEARFALLQQRSRQGKQVFTEEQMLELLTMGGARALGMEDRIGSLEAGKLADLIAVRIPPVYRAAEQVVRHLIHNTTAADVMKTIIGGQEIKRNHEGTETPRGDGKK